MNFIKIALDGVPQELRKEIENQLPPPLEVLGWKFVGYKWRKLTQINTKDKNGNTNNTVRVAGTGDNDVLQVSLKKGLDLSCHTPSIYPNDNLINGFNRLKQLKLLGYKEWIFAEYEQDEFTKTEFQDTFEDALDDARASMNKGSGQKVITDTEVEELGRKRFGHRIDVEKDDIKRWVTTLNLNLSYQKIEAIANAIAKDFQRIGRIESYNREEAEQFLEKLGIGADLLNTYGHKKGSDPTRTLRLLYQIMSNFVENIDTMHIALYDSQAVGHDDLDENREASVELLDSMDKLIMKYAGARMANMNIQPYEILGAIPQATGRENQQSGLVEIA